MNWRNKITYKLFIDDERSPVTDDWVVVRSSDDAICCVAMYGMPSEIAFDHDLGGSDTSRNFCHWLLDRVLDGKEEIPSNFKFSVHSQNPVGKKWIEDFMHGMINYL